MTIRGIYSFSLSEEVVRSLTAWLALPTTVEMFTPRTESEETELDVPKPDNSWGLIPTDYDYLAKYTKTVVPVLRPFSKGDWRAKLMTPEALWAENVDLWVQKIYTQPGVDLYVKTAAAKNRPAYKRALKASLRRKKQRKPKAVVNRSRAVEYLINLALETLRGQETGTPANAGQAGNKPANRRARRKVAA